MKLGFYSRLARTNMKNNYRFFIPRILSEAGLLGSFYIMLNIARDHRLAEVYGGSYLPLFMGFGAIVLAILTVILMLYTNSFLMKQRKQELGLYNVLGMEKKHVGKVLFYETLWTSLIAIAGGLVFGTLFYKICSLLVCRLLHADILAGFYYVTTTTFVYPAAFFLMIDVVTYLINLISVARMKPVELLKSRFTGEKEPKVKWPILIIGLVTLGTGYYLSVSTKSPLQAILLFFLAVILVMIGTYCLFVTGSIFILKCLKRRSSYYYTKDHMPAVSGLLYRMKQNAVGLASIAILATGILIMISTTVALYSGMEDTLKKNFPQHYYLSRTVYTDNEEGDVIRPTEIPYEVIKEMVEKAAGEQKLEIQSLVENDTLEVTYLMENGELSMDQNNLGVDFSMDNLVMLTFVTDEEYKNFTGDSLELAENEVAICSLDVSKEFGLDHFKLAGRDFTVAKTLDFFPVSGGLNSMASCFGVVVSDQETLDAIYQDQKEGYGDYASEYYKRVVVTFEDLDEFMEKGVVFNTRVWELFEEYCDSKGYAGANWSTDSIVYGREALYSMYGSMLFLGILLGFVFMFATALIIYYKQISEGYEDRDRFQIMKKIGMSEAEIKKTINKQIVMVFYLPLLVAGVHMAFAFPILHRLLTALLLQSTRLFVVCSLVVFALFSVVYVLIYKATARTYYRIVR